MLTCPYTELEKIRKKINFDKLVKEFYQRNKVNDETNEEYLENFRLRLGKFLSQKSLNRQENLAVKKIIFKCLKEDYRFYSEAEIIRYLKSFHKQFCDELLNRGLNLNDCYFTDVLNKKTMKTNSSDMLAHLYLKENRLSNNHFIRLNKMVEIEMNNQNHQNNYRGYKYYTKKIYKKEVKNEIADKHKLLSNKKYLIMIDDYSGTGSTIKDFIGIIKKYIPKHIKLIIFCIHITENAKKVLEDFFDKEKIACQIISVETSKKYFHNNPVNEDLIKNFEEKFVKPRRERDILGFDKTQSVLTTFMNTPNNTLSLFWSESIVDDGWRPIFTRKDKDGKLGKLSKVLELGKKIKWYFKYKKIPVNISEQLILLTYLNNKKRMTISTFEVEISHIICYTDKVIVECERQNYIYRINSYYELSDDGLNFLKNNSLDSPKLFGKIEKEFEKFGKQMEGNQNDSSIIINF